MAVLEATDVSKAYPGVQALSGVALKVNAGEVHALLGENGAGKSTLIKIFAGSVVPDTGELRVAGDTLSFGSPEEARELGVSIVHQELSLVPSLTIAENVMLGRWPSSRFGIDWNKLADEADRHLTRVGFEGHPPDERVRQLGMAERQQVEIAKALSTNPKVLLLDEPTSALSEPEAERLFEIIVDLTNAGVAVIYVSHRLAEVMRIADRITVLRDGELVATQPASELDEDQLARLMVGRDVRGVSPREERANTPDRVVALQTISLTRPPSLQSIDLRVDVGEVVAVFGLVGSGRSQLGRAIFGIDRPDSGHIEVFGQRVSIDEPAQAIELGLGYVAPDRALGIVSKLSVAANVTLAALPELGSGPMIDFKRERELASEYIEELDIRVDSPDRPAGDLSGGNQQKAILARWLCVSARVLILDDPTRGIDVGAKEEVFRLVRDLAEQGTAILYLTSEIVEASGLGERVVVMAGGQIVEELPGGADEQSIMAAAGGVSG